jgi:hypothetical protein
MELSHQEFAATWRHHFKQPVHPLAEKLLASSKRTVWLKEYDSEYTSWRLEGKRILYRRVYLALRC